MRSDVAAAIHGFLADHHGVVTLAQAQRLGVDRAQIHRALASGELQAIHRGVYVLSGVRPTAKTLLYAACAAAGPGSAGSHLSAAWAWHLVRRPPPRPSLVISEHSRRRLAGVDVHRSRQLPTSAVAIRKGIPITTPARTLVDVATVVTARQLDRAVDVALAERIVRVQMLWGAVDHLSRQGRPGVPVLRASLQRRGLLEPPEPSVLESMALRLLASWGIIPLGVEVVVCEGRYRVDILLAPGLVLEVDGFAFHSSPEAKASDSRRRNALRLAGYLVVESDWVIVTRHPGQLRGEVFAALAATRRQSPPSPLLSAG